MSISVSLALRNNCNEGYIEIAAQATTTQLTTQVVKIKRKEFNGSEWMTIHIATISTVDDLSFTIRDNLAKSGIKYQYAYVPINSGTEGNYTVGEITSSFFGVFICDKNSIYKFYSDVGIGATANPQMVGMYAPFGRKYPIPIRNSIINYQSGSFSGAILPAGYEYGGVALDRNAMHKRSKIVVDFLTNKKAKILKTVNGNMCLCMIVSNVGITYSDYNMGAIPYVSAQWVEIGNKDSNVDMFNAGMIPTSE